MIYDATTSRSVTVSFDATRTVWEVFPTQFEVSWAYFAKIHHSRASLQPFASRLGVRASLVFLLIGRE